MLGGHDLEMITIKRLLLANGYKENENFFDKNLKWGAKLSSYQKELTKLKDKTIYGIELIEDITIPANYIKIDHHNEYSHKEASLMQILKLLGKSPTREDNLIIANDIGHIEAMKCIRATEEEIQKIRKQEREIQGVTAKDEQQAQKDIQNRIEQNGIYIIETKLKSFSPIVDNFLDRPLLVYSDSSLVYYGDIESLKNRYKEEIIKNEAYHGRGYFGFSSEYLKSKNIKKIVEDIVSIPNKKYMISYHNFMFPFRFDKITKVITDKHQFYKDESFDNRVKIDEELKSSLKANKLEYQKFEVKNGRDYNELVYFHDFVKDTLFNTQDFDKNATSYYFEKELNQDAKYEIKIKDKNLYILNLEGVNLRLFDTGVGILSFEVENYKYKEFEDILKINEYGRRIYPQFLEYDYCVNRTKNAFLADYIKVNGIKEDFSQEYKKIEIAKFILDILGENSFTTNKSKVGSNFIQPIIDDRMFVLSWYGNDTCSSMLRKREWIDSDNWYRYVFVDGNNKTVQDNKMQEELIQQATYSRWNDYGTLFGITRYSFNCLTDEDFGKNFILNHIKTIYFQMVILLLAQRASLLRFSDEITAISDIDKDKPSAKQISILYKNYLRFVNKLYFKEVTAQDQGIELYDKAIEILNIKRDIEDLRTEIGSLNSYAFLEQEREEKEEMNKITKLGAIFLPPTLLAGVYGANIFNFSQTFNDITIGIVAMVLVAVVGFLFVEAKKGYWKFTSIIIMIAIMIASVILIGEKEDSNKEFSSSKTDIIKKV